MKLARISTAAVTATLVCLAPVPALAADGSAGLGDNYFPKAGNGGYDARHYRLALDYDPATDELVGDARIRSVADQRLHSFHLDFVGLEISDVQVGGEPAGFERKGQELIITPQSSVARGSAFVTRVQYSGVPSTYTDPDGSSEGWTTTSDGSAALGEPVGSMAWFPCNNHPTDKAKYKFKVTVPSGITAVANGKLTKQEAQGADTLFVWSERDPMASYLAVLATGVFVVDDTPINGIPSWAAVDPLAAANQFSQMGAMLEFLESTYGRYPLGSTGGIGDVNPTLGYALETQTKPYYSTPALEGTILHELAHQWYGDSVTLGRWRDIWLNEGFATYSEWLWDEHNDGPTPAQTFNQEYATDAGNDGFWNPPPGNPKPEHLFDSTVYTRGAMTLQALREEIGKQDFFKLLVKWHARNKGSYGTTPMLRRLAERISGEQLDKLFHDWLYEEGKPQGYGKRDTAKGSSAPPRASAALR